MAKTRLSDVVLFETSIDLSKEQRTKMIDLLNERLADTIDLKTQAKHAHWNVKGIQFHQLHQLFDEIAGHLEEHADPAGGSGADSMVLAVGHRANGRAILDLVRERKPPFSPASVVSEFCDVLKNYRCARVTGDAWGGEFCRQPFRERGIEYVLAAKNRSELYLHLLPMINSGACELLDNPRLIAQIANLERRTSIAGRDAVDHPRGQHDDCSNAVAGVLVSLSQRRQISFLTGLDVTTPAHAEREAAMMAGVRSEPDPEELRGRFFTPGRGLW